MTTMTPKYRGAFALAMEYQLTLTGDPEILYSDLEERGWFWIEDEQLWELHIPPIQCPTCGAPKNRLIMIPSETSMWVRMECRDCGRRWLEGKHDLAETP